MPYKKLFLLALTLLCSVGSFAQETVQKKNKIADGLIERYMVLKDSPDIKQGLYQVFTRQNKLVVRGGYTKDRKTGIWHFYDKNVKLLQIYDYDKKRLMFEAKQYVGSNISYLVDKVLTNKDTVTKPIKIGGRYFGYLPYLALYRPPFSPYEYNIYGAEANVELLISPLGRLAGYKVIAVFPYMDYTQTLNMDVNLFKEEDRQFIPATLNHEPILSRIIIRCKIDDDGTLQFRNSDEY